MISTIVSDFGGVLTVPLYDAFVAYSEHCGIPLEQFWTALGTLTTQAGGVNPMAELETARITEAEFLEALGGQIAKQTGGPADISDFSPVWFSHLHPNTEMFELMRSLKARDYRMALLTNNVREWEPHWRPKLPIDEIFEVVVDSGFVEMRKPDPAIYTLTRERLGVAPEAILFIDDMDVNIDAARAAGWNAVHFQNNAQAIAEIEALLDADRSASAL